MMKKLIYLTIMAAFLAAFSPGIKDAHAQDWYFEMSNADGELTAGEEYIVNIYFRGLPENLPHTYSLNVQYNPDLVTFSNNLADVPIYTFFDENYDQRWFKIIDPRFDDIQTGDNVIGFISGDEPSGAYCLFHPNDPDYIYPLITPPGTNEANNHLVRIKFTADVTGPYEDIAWLASYPDTAFTTTAHVDGRFWNDDPNSTYSEGRMYFQKMGTSWITSPGHVLYMGMLICQGFPRWRDVFPYEPLAIDYPENPEYTGAAAARQTIRWMWGEIPDDPCQYPADYDWPFQPTEGAFYENYPVEKSVAWLHEQYGTDEMDFTPAQMRACVQAQKPTDRWYGGGLIEPSYAYNFAVEQDADEDLAMRRFVHWTDFNINKYYSPDDIDGPVDNPQVAPLVATNDGNDGYKWLTVRGIVTSTDPCDESSVFTIPDLTVTLLWLNDPAIGGLGAQCCITGDEFKDNWYEPVDGSFWSVCEPPEDLDQEIFNENLTASRIECEKGKISMQLETAVQKMAGKGVAMMTEADAAELSSDFEEINWDSVIPQELIHNTDFGEVYENSRFSGVMIVDDLKAGNTYQLVTFTQEKMLEVQPIDKNLKRLASKRIVRLERKKHVNPDATASIVLLVDGETGMYRQATWVSRDEKYPRLSRKEAGIIAKDAAEASVVGMRMVFDDEAGSRFTPVYEASMLDGSVVRVFQDGTYELAE